MEKIRIKMYRGFANKNPKPKYFGWLTDEEANGSTDITPPSGSSSSTHKGLTQEQSDALLAGLSQLFTIGAGIYTGTAEQRALKKKIEAKCGKRPHGIFGLKGKKKKEAIAKWKKCAEAYMAAHPTTTDVNDFLDGGDTGTKDKDDEKKPAIGTAGWVAISVVGVAVLSTIGVIIYKMANKKNAATAAATQA